jgi:hypothetical protein
MRAVTLTLIITALVLGSGCAQKDWIDRTLVTVDVTGKWYGQLQAIGSRAILFDLEQQGSTVKGALQLGPGGNQPIESGLALVAGTVAGDVFRFRETRGSIEGELSVGGDEMAGRMSVGGPSWPISLTRRSILSPGFTTSVTR